MIDFLSINQRNAHKKNHQVCLMREIYQNARNVVVWLGNDDDNTATACSSYQAIEWEQASDWTDATYYAWPYGCRRPLCHDEFSSRDGQSNLVEQNVDYSGGCPGSESSPGLWLLCYRMGRFGPGVHLQPETSPYMLRSGHWEQWGARVGGLHRGLSWTRQLAPTESQNAQARSITIDILELLSRFADRAVTDPRDKLYGLLGLAPGDCADSIKVKYDIPVEEVQQRSAISIIKVSGSLDVFACVNSSKIRFKGLWLVLLSLLHRTEVPAYVWYNVSSQSNQVLGLHVRFLPGPKAELYSILMISKQHQTYPFFPSLSLFHLSTLQDP